MHTAEHSKYFKWFDSAICLACDWGIARLFSKSDLLPTSTPWIIYLKNDCSNKTTNTNY